MNTNSTFFSFDPATSKWDVVLTKSYQQDSSNMPPGADEHSAVVFEDCMYIFGGFIDGDKVNCVY